MQLRRFALCIMALICSIAAAADSPPVARDFEAMFESVVAAGAQEGDEFLAYAAWLPTQLFDAMAQLATPSEQLEVDRADLLKSVSPYAIFVVAQAELLGEKQFNWLGPEDIFQHLEVTFVDAAGEAHALKKASRVKPMAKDAVAPVQRILVEAFGVNASHFFFWYGESPTALSLSPLSPGRIVVRFQLPNGEKVDRELTLPLKPFTEPVGASPPVDASPDGLVAKPGEATTPGAASGKRSSDIPNKSVADQCERRALELINRGQLDQAVQLIDQSLAARGGAHRVEDPSVRAALAMKARTFFQMGRLDESEAVLSFMQAEPEGPVLDPFVAATDGIAWSTLTDIYLLRRDYARAHKSLTRSRQCDSANSRREPIVVLQHKMTDSFKASQILAGLNDLDAAQKELDLAWAMYCREFSSDDATLGIFANTYGLLAEKRGDYAEAESRYAEAERLAIKSQGPASPARLRAMTFRHRACDLQGKSQEVAVIEREAAELTVAGFASTRALMGLTPKPVGQREIDKSLSTAQGRREKVFVWGGVAMISIFFLTYGGLGSLFRKVGSQLWWSAAKLTAAFCVVLFFQTLVVMTVGRSIPALNILFSFLFAWWAVRSAVSAYRRAEEEDARYSAPPRVAAGMACTAIALVAGPFAVVANLALAGGEPRYPTRFEAEIFNLGGCCLVVMAAASLFCLLVGLIQWVLVPAKRP